MTGVSGKSEKDVASYRGCDRQCEERIAYNRRVDSRDRRKRSASRRKRRRGARFSWGFPVLSRKFAKQQMKLTVVGVGALQKYKLRECIRALEKLINRLNELKGFSGKEKQVVRERVRLQIGIASYRYLLTSSEGAASKGARSVDGGRKKLPAEVALTIKRAAPGCVMSKQLPKLKRLLNETKIEEAARALRLTRPTAPAMGAGEAERPTPPLVARRAPLAVVMAGFLPAPYPRLRAVKTPPIIQAYYSYVNARGADRQWTGKHLEELVVDPKTEINAQDAKGETLLHKVAASPGEESTYLLKQLLQRPDVDLQLENYNKETPMMVAIRAGNQEAVKTFLEFQRMRPGFSGGKSNLAIQGSLQYSAVDLQRENHSEEMSVVSAVCIGNKGEVEAIFISQKKGVAFNSEKSILTNQKLLQRVDANQQPERHNKGAAIESGNEKGELVEGKKLKIVIDGEKMANSLQTKKFFRLIGSMNSLETENCYSGLDFQKTPGNFTGIDNLPFMGDKIGRILI